MKHFFIFFLLFISTLGLWAADEFPEAPNRLVNDQVGILSSSEVQALEQKLLNYEDTTSNQFAILIVNEVPGGYDYSDYAERVAEKWKIGKEGKDNGLLIFLTIKERKIWIATGYGLEGSIPDARSKDIIERYFVPYFKQGQYYQGFDQGTSALIMAAAGEFEADPASSKNQPWTPLIVVIIIVLIIMMISQNRKGGKGDGYTTYSGRGYNRGGFYGGGFGGGFGGGSSGGGFGGFGGGGFGGGGSGGSW